MKTEKEEEEYKVKMEELKNFLFLVNVYTSEFYAGFKLSEVIKENKYALAYAASKYFNTCKTGNKKVDEYILRMH